jgi:hypothetical protein
VAGADYAHASHGGCDMDVCFVASGLSTLLWIGLPSASSQRSATSNEQALQHGRQAKVSLTPANLECLGQSYQSVQLERVQVPVQHVTCATP